MSSPWLAPPGSLFGSEAPRIPQPPTVPIVDSFRRSRQVGTGRSGPAARQSGAGRPSSARDTPVLTIEVCLKRGLPITREAQAMTLIAIREHAGGGEQIGRASCRERG